MRLSRSTLSNGSSGSAAGAATGGGVTLARHHGTFGFLPDGKVTLAESTGAGFVFGSGLAVAAGERFEIGPEVRFLTLGADVDSSPAFACWVGARFGVRF